MWYGAKDLSIKTVAILFSGILFLAAAFVALAPGQASAETRTVSGNYAVLEKNASISQTKVTTYTLMFKYSASETSVMADAVFTGFDTTAYNNYSAVPWHPQCRDITKVSFDDSVEGKLRPISTAFWFYDMRKLESIEGLGGLDASNVTDMHDMFAACTSLASLDVSGLNTSEVTNTTYMFSGCESLTSLKISGLDTSKVTNMRAMFSQCDSLSSLDVSGLDTSNATDMSAMFAGCYALSSLNISSWDTSSATSMSGLFAGCRSLKTIYAGDFWSIKKIDPSTNLFSGCQSLVGGNGTIYDETHIDAGYARVDAADDPGYFTGVASMHRLYNPNSGEHFYTADDAERDKLVSVGWNSEGEGWTAPATSNTPVYRMYNPVAGEHHYCMDESEKDMLVDADWNYEGVGWYSDDNQTVPLYRDYNPNEFANNHNYTVDVSEHDNLVSLGWQWEGYAWYGI